MRIWGLTSKMIDELLIFCSVIAAIIGVIGGIVKGENLILLIALIVALVLANIRISCTHYPNYPKL